MGGTCSTYGGEEKSIQGFGGGNLRERDHLEKPGIDEKWISRMWVERMGSIGLRTGTCGGLLRVK